MSPDWMKDDFEIYRTPYSKGYTLILRYQDRMVAKFHMHDPDRSRWAYFPYAEVGPARSAWVSALLEALGKTSGGYTREWVEEVVEAAHAGCGV